MVALTINPPLSTSTVAIAPSENDPSNSNRATPLVVEGLSKTYPGGARPVFSDVSFRITQGQQVAIIGANGAGKSTLLRCCLRLLEPNTGRILIEGRDFRTCSGRELRRARARVGMVFQKHHLVTRLSVLSNVLHGALAYRSGPRTWYHALARSEDRAYAMHCLELVGIAEFANRRADRLSGGQSQRVAIARALMQRPRMLFADEPAASLDPRAGEEIMALFASLAQQEDLTLVFVSHHLEHATRYSNRIIGLNKGSLRLDESTRNVSIDELKLIFA